MNEWELYFERPLFLLLLFPAILLILFPVVYRSRKLHLNVRKMATVFHSIVALLLILVIAGLSVKMPEQSELEEPEEMSENETERVVVIAEQKDQASFLTPYLPEVLDVQVITPEEAPVSTSELTKTKEIILLGVSADALPESFQDTLSQYVQSGGTLLMAGSDHSFSLGGMKDTAYETLMPVSLDYDRNDGEGTALMLVLDCSNSMSGQRGFHKWSRRSGRGYEDESLDSSTESLSMAKQGAIKSIESLENNDEVGIISFNSYADVQMPLSPATDTQKAAASRVISSLTTSQGTYYGDALQLARTELANSTAATRHVIFLSDGEPSDGSYDSIVQQMQAEGITVSTIALGYSSQILQGMAEEGGGRYYAVTGVSDLPDTMLEETKKVAADPLVEEATEVMLAGGIPSGLPVLGGYVGTTLKEQAEMKLQTESGDPLWASWTIGDGSVSAFTSDLFGEWSASWFDKEAAGWQLKQILQAGIHLSENPAEESMEDAKDPAFRTLHLLIPLLFTAMLLFLSELICRKFRLKDVLAVFHRESETGV